MMPHEFCYVISLATSTILPREGRNKFPMGSFGLTFSENRSKVKHGIYSSQFGIVRKMRFKEVWFISVLRLFASVAFSPQSILENERPESNQILGYDSTGAGGN